MLRVREEGRCSWALKLSTEGCRYPEMAFLKGHSIVEWLRDCRPWSSSVGRVACEFLLEMTNNLPVMGWDLTIIILMTTMELDLQLVIIDPLRLRISVKK